MPDALELLLTRRSVVARNLTDPGPGAEELENILRAGLRVPDHGKLGPWRFIVIQGAARTELGEMLVRAHCKNVEADPLPAKLEFIRQTFTRAPLVIAVVSSPKLGKIPEWEQVLSSGAACQNMLLAANAQGYVGQWITEWYAYDADVKATLKLTPDERISGFIYIGSTREPSAERVRPELDDVVSYWSGKTSGHDA